MFKIFNNNKIRLVINALVICCAVASAKATYTPCQRYAEPYFNHGIYTNFEGEPLGYLLESTAIFLATQRANFTQSYYSSINQINDWMVPGKPPRTSDHPIVTWLGHATFLIQVGGINILTDPVFFDLSWFYPRNAPLSISLEQLPPIDVVLISHSHRDHLDESSLKLLMKDSPLLLLPKNTPIFTFFDRSKIKNLTWWESYTLAIETATSSTEAPRTIKFTFLPSRHWSNRSLFDINQSLWGSWMVQYNDFNLYFAGDSAYDEHFTKIAEHYPSINIALLPVGPNEPRELMADSHMSAEEAGQAFIDLKAHTFVPMHWGTFRLGTDCFDTPIKRLTTWWKAHEQELEDKELLLVKFGQTVN